MERRRKKTKTKQELFTLSVLDLQSDQDKSDQNKPYQTKSKGDKK